MKLNQTAFYILLALAAADKELKGYDTFLLARYITGNRSLMRPSAVYPVLKQLDTVGLVERIKPLPAKLDQKIEFRKKLYRITDFGRKALVKELRQLDKVNTAAYRAGLLP